jgi:uncharacterized membrane protein YeaQ/YmgE (transglycosylase-associated protein family)
VTRSKASAPAAACQTGHRPRGPCMKAGNRGTYSPMLAFIVVLIIVGLIVGLIARLLLPGRDSIGILGTIILGIVGSFVGGFLQQLIEHHHLEVHHFQTVGIIGSIIGAIVVLLLLRVSGMEPGHRRGRSRSSSRRHRWI